MNSCTVGGHYMYIYVYINNWVLCNRYTHLLGICLKAQLCCFNTDASNQIKNRYEFTDKTFVLLLGLSFNCWVMTQQIQMVPIS